MIKNIHIMKNENSPTAATIVADRNIGTRTIVEELILSSNVKAVMLQKIKPQLYLRSTRRF